MRWMRMVLACALLLTAWPYPSEAQNTAARPLAPADDPDKRSERVAAGLHADRRCRRRCACRSSRARSASPIASCARSDKGDFGDLANDFFGLDSGAQIGLEYRFGLMRGLQAGIHRTSDKTIEFFAQYSLLQQRDGGKFGSRRTRVDRRHQQLQGQLYARSIGVDRLA